MDVSADVAYVMAPKEEPELLIMKKACFVSVDVFNKYLKDQIMEIIDSDKVSILVFNSSRFFLLVECMYFCVGDSTCEQPVLHVPKILSVNTFICTITVF